uniref:A kinase (PRKA) anchor protein 1b n=1 Tax=Scleropages formosus TaxID=113540 RepID=A0A8C9VM31_SCLFO
MPLRFRSFVPYTLPGVLVLIGWWWYISRKKGRITSHDKEEGTAMGLRASPIEGSNGLVELCCTTTAAVPNRTTRDRPKAVGDKPAEQQVLAEVHTAAQPPRTPSPPLSSGTPPFLRVSRVPEEEVASNPTSSALSESKQTVTSALGPPKQVCKLLPDKKETGGPAEISNVVRPEPEGEVAADKITVPFMENLQLDLVKEELSTLPSVGDHGYKPARQDSPCPEPTLSSSSCQATPSLTPQSGVARENGLLADHAESGTTEEIERLAAGLITEVISAAAQEVLAVSHSDQGRTARRTSELSSSTPMSNGRPCAARELLRDGGLTPVEAQHLLQEGSSPTGCAETGRDKEVNGCLGSPAWQTAEDSSSDTRSRRRAESGQRITCLGLKHEATPPSLAKLQSEEAITGAEDSGCSTCQSEDGISSEDLLHSTGLSCTPPETKEVVMHISDISTQGPGKQHDGTARSTSEGAPPQHGPCVQESKALNDTGLRNGSHMSETEADHSGGSDVNSMDSVDSGCTLGAGDGSHASRQATHPQTSELIIWEIEVPKHLVGRLIGKQGRYVSFLKQSSGAKIYISTLPYTQEFQICHIEGTQQQVDKALALIGKKFKDLDLTNLYAPPPLPITLPSLPMTSWLLLPNGVTVEVIVVNIVSAGHAFVQQHTHPTYHALRSLDQQMFLCYSQPGTPALPSPVEVGVICAAPAGEGAWWRAQVISFYKDSGEVEIRYVDYGGYDRVKIDTLRQIRSDFVTLPFQGAEVLLDNLAPLPGADRFSPEATAALEEMTRGVPLLAQVTNYDSNTGLPLVQLWNMVGDELVSVNRTLAERGFGTWVDSF